METLYSEASEFMAREFSEYDWVWDGPVHNGPFANLAAVCGEVDACCHTVLTGHNNQELSEPWPEYEGDADQLASCIEDRNFLIRYRDSVNEDPAIAREIAHRLTLLAIQQSAETYSA